MVHAQFESAQLRPSESGGSSHTESASAKMLLEAQSYQVSDRTVSHARGTPTDQDRATTFERYLSDLCNPHK